MEKLQSVSLDNVETSYRNSNYKSLKIKATDAPVHVDNIQVIYQTDESENIPIRFDYKPGTESRAIDLKGKLLFEP